MTSTPIFIIYSDTKKLESIKAKRVKQEPPKKCLLQFIAFHE